MSFEQQDVEVKKKFSYRHFLRLLVIKKEVNESEKSETNIREEWFCLVVLLATFICNLITEGFFSSYSVIYNSVMESFQVSRAVAGWVGSMFLSIPFILGPISSWVCKKVGCRFCALLGGSLTVLGWMLASFSPNISALFIFLGVLTPIGISLIAIPTIVIVPVYFDKKMSLASSECCLLLAILLLWLFL